MNTLITNALEDMVAGLTDEKTDWGITWGRSDARRTTQMRFDAESTVELSMADAAELVAKEMSVDLNNLVVHGTGGSGNNPLLTNFVGSEKSGKELTAFYIQEALLLFEYKQKAKRWDYTLYCVVYAEYDNEPAKTW